MSTTNDSSNFEVLYGQVIKRGYRFVVVYFVKMIFKNKILR